MDSEFFQPLFTWLANHPATVGWAIFIVALTESLVIVGLIVPGAVLMLGIGALIGADIIAFPTAVVWAFTGAVIGDGVSFFIGRYYQTALHQVWPFKTRPQLLQRGNVFFIRHGGKSVFFGRFVGPIRPIIPAVAGMMGMDTRYFFLCNVLSAAIWAPVYLLPGMAFTAF